MGLKTLIARQYREQINEVRKKLEGLSTPSEGWLRTARKALGMSGAQFARRAGVSRALVSKTEISENSGSVTLKTMQQMAAAMNCRFVYAVVPERDVEDILDARAHEKASEIVKQAGVHMALEDQALSNERLHAEIERLGKELRDTPSNLWDE
ncbi:mobile mystery protein A [Marinagarivorans cellulosilyticus]|uniref:HTH cro/C1-type domain-containing protein n=1 Tax=Marinagarivorans cellulosilyticus TaxID=2721545 RepID=A0AAN1WFI5_9GAMM|nr:mobile mystery protein A [Marinagarivorans cellulosilyticus]BCD96651.1 hypothetical protein MARGE09_P0851 [Marinagarivorans cellulosilyticus]